MLALTSAQDHAINGFAAEQIVARMLKRTKASKVSFNSHELIETARATEIGKARLAKAMPYLLSQYGRPVSKKYSINWASVPPQVILDLVFGLDHTFSWRGWMIGLDVTTDETAIADKQWKLQQLRPLWTAIGIDCVAVCYVSQSPQPEQLNNALKQIIKGQTLVSL